MKKIRKLLAYLMILTLLPVYAAAEEAVLKPFADNTVPGEIMVANFDYGGDGVAYKLSAKDSPAAFDYREDASTNFYRGDGFVFMGYMPGNWTIYTLNVKKKAEYRLSAVYANGNTPVVLAISFDDGVTTDYGIPATASWSDYKELELDTITLTPGRHTMKLYNRAGGLNFKSIKLTDQSTIKELKTYEKSGAYRNVFVPSYIQGENYDYTTYVSADGKNNGNEYRKTEPMDVYKGASGYYLKIDKGEQTTYTFSVEQSGAYTLFANANGDGEVYIDGADLPIALYSPKFEEKELDAIWLDEGTHVITLKTDSGIELDWLKFANAEKDYITLDMLKAEETGQEEKEPVHKIYKEFYVSENGSDDAEGSRENPFASIGRAKEAAAEISDNMDGDIIVNIQPGYYQLDKTEIFNETHSGKNGFNIIYRGTNIANPPVISGGTKITGWEPMGNGIWKASAPIEDTRTLYINTYPAQRAHSKYKYTCAEMYTAPGSKYEYDGILVKSKNFPDKFEHPEELELCWPLFWTYQRTPVQDVIDEGEYTKILMDNPCLHNAVNIGSYVGIEPAKGALFVIENAMELLDEPGEFYFNKTEKMIYYYPFEAEDLTTAETYCGTTEFLIKTVGSDLDNKVENLIFENLDFRYGAWNDASVRGVVVNQADELASDKMNTGKWDKTCLPAQFEIEYAKNITVKDCKFISLGSGGISMFNAVSDSKVIGNVFRDISGTAVIIGSYQHDMTIPEGEERVKNIEVGHNVIRRVANEFYGSCGISIYWPQKVQVHNNEIMDVPYSGMTVGWGWSVNKVPDCSDIIISANRIMNVNDTCRDGGHIYTLGTLKNSVIERNHLVKSHDYRGGLYLDAGSSYLTLKENVIEDVELWTMILADGLHTDVNVIDNYIDEDQNFSYMSDPVDYETVTESGTFFKYDNEWPQEALDIMAEAGPQGIYKRLLSGNELPKWRRNWIHDYQTETYVEEDKWTEAEQYKPGGQDITWNYTLGEKPWAYTYGGSFITVLGRGTPGDWQIYDVIIEEDGKYDCIIYAGNANDPTSRTSANVYVDGELVIQKGIIKNTPEWGIFEEQNVGSVYLTKGKHEVKMEYAEQAWNFDKFVFRKADKEVSYENDPFYDEGVIVPEYTYTFDDISGHWAEEDIDKMGKKAIIRGTGNDMFTPEGKLSLYQSIWLAMRAARIKYTQEEWKETAAKYGMLKGLDEQDAPVSRERFAEVILKAIETQRVLYEDKDKLISFSDMQSIGEEYIQSVNKLSGIEILKGDENGNFNPKATLTRAEGATIIARVYQLLLNTNKAR